MEWIGPLNNLVRGNKMIRNSLIIGLVVALLASLGTSYYLFKKDVTATLKVETKIQQNYIETRKRIDEAVAPAATPDAARARLLERQAARNK